MRSGRRTADAESADGVALAIATIEEPLGHAGVRTRASSPGSSTQRMPTLSACTPDAVITISLSRIERRRALCVMGGDARGAVIGSPAFSV